MQDFIATAFVAFLFVMYAGITLAFIVAGVRRWLARPSPVKSAPRRQQESYHEIKSATH